jgi:hypothetical protein
MQKKAKKVVLAFGLASGVGVVNPALPVTGLVQQAEAKRRPQLVRFDINRGAGFRNGPRRQPQVRRDRAYGRLPTRRLHGCGYYSGCGGVTRRPARYVGCGGVTRRPNRYVGCGGIAPRRTVVSCGGAVTRRPNRYVGCGGSYAGCGGVTRRPNRYVGCGGIAPRRTVVSCGGAVTRRPTRYVGCGGFSGVGRVSGCGVSRPPSRVVGCGYSGCGAVYRRRYRAC